MANTMELRARYYRALPINDAGYEDVSFELEINKTALIGMHCWNIGCPDGPPQDMNFCVDLGWPEATAEGYRIMEEVMRPAMDIARKIGLPVVHVLSLIHI